MSHIMKPCGTMIEDKIGHELNISENKFGFMARRSTYRSYLLIRKLMKNYI